MAVLLKMHGLNLIPHPTNFDRRTCYKTTDLFPSKPSVSPKADRLPVRFRLMETRARIVNATHTRGLDLELETHCSKRHSWDDREFGYGFYDGSIGPR